MPEVETRFQEQLSACASAHLHGKNPDSIGTELRPLHKRDRVGADAQEDGICFSLAGREALGLAGAVRVDA